jgi:hypothetical protein
VLTLEDWDVLVLVDVVVESCEDVEDDVEDEALVEEDEEDVLGVDDDDEEVEEDDEEDGEVVEVELVDVEVVVDLARLMAPVRLIPRSTFSLKKIQTSDPPTDI